MLLKKKNKAPFRCYILDTEKEKKNTIQHAGYICKFCELGHTAVPYGVRAQGHAAGTNQREKTPRLLQGETHHMHRGGKQNQTAGEPQGRKFQKQEFRASRKKKIPRRGRRHQCSSRDGSVEQTPFRGRKTPG